MTVVGGRGERLMEEGGGDLDDCVFSELVGSAELAVSAGGECISFREEKSLGLGFTGGGCLLELERLSSCEHVLPPCPSLVGGCHGNVVLE